MQNVLIWGTDYILYNIRLKFSYLYIFWGGGVVALRTNACHGLLILDVSRSHTMTQHSR
jgi:hypothetical protein